MSRKQRQALIDLRQAYIDAVEFNEDGSIRLLNHVARSNQNGHWYITKEHPGFAGDEFGVLVGGVGNTHEIRMSVANELVVFVMNDADSESEQDLEDDVQNEARYGASPSPA